jgi:hypothetical protein
MPREAFSTKAGRLESEIEEWSRNARFGVENLLGSPRAWPEP